MNKRRSKGQSSIEFLSMVALSALILAILQGVMVSKQSEAVEYENRENAETVARKAAFQIEMAMVQGEGYSRVFSVPDSIAGGPYTVEVRDRAAELNWSGGSAIVSSRYQGDSLLLNTSKSNIYRVVNNGNITFSPE